MGISISADGTVVGGPLKVLGGGAELDSSLKVLSGGMDISGAVVLRDGLRVEGHGAEILGDAAVGGTVTAQSLEISGGITAESVVAGTVDASTLNGLDSTAFVQRYTGGTIIAVHTFNPATPAAPFILGANGCGQLITGLNADLLDGYDVTDLPLLAGRANEQTLYGGINAQGNLVLNSTSHYTKGQVCLGMDGSKIAVGTSPANILGGNALATFFSNGSLFIELAGDVNAAGNVIAEIIGVAKYNLITDYDFRRQASLAIVMEGTTDLRRGSRIEIKTRMDNDGPVGARRVATFTTCGNLNIGTSGQGPSVQCSGAVFLEYGINPVSTRAGHSGFFTSLTNGVYTASCINGDGNIIKFMRQAKISLTSDEMYSLTCPFGTPGDTLTNISADWTDDTKTAIRNNFRSLTRSINSIIGVVADIRTKLDTFIAQHVTAGFNAS